MREQLVENFRPRDKVVYLGCSDEQVRWGNNDDPRSVLVEGDTYYIENVDVHSQHTKLTLSGISGRFNSVCFSRFEEK